MVVNIEANQLRKDMKLAIYAQTEQRGNGESSNNVLVEDRKEKDLNSCGGT